MGDTNYSPLLDILETQEALSFCKKSFEKYLAQELQLIRIEAPRYVRVKSGLQDGLDGTIESIKFRPLHLDDDVEIVHSLAKWKRKKLGDYKIELHKGIFTNMEAIRKDDVLDDLHSFFVDQWDWELVIDKGNRHSMFLKFIVEKIFKALRRTQLEILRKFPKLNPEFIKDNLQKRNQENSDVNDVSNGEKENKKRNELENLNEDKDSFKKIKSSDEDSSTTPSTEVPDDMETPFLLKRPESCSTLPLEMTELASPSMLIGTPYCCRKSDANLFKKTTIDEEFQLSEEEKKYATKEFDYLLLPEKIQFIHAEDLIDRYPHCKTPRERETEAAKEFGAYFLTGIGSKLKDGRPHDIRAFDYDDYSTIDGGKVGLNGDIIVYNPINKRSMELSSMGIRVDASALKFQAYETIVNKQDNLNPQEISKTMNEMMSSRFHQHVLQETIPHSIGGGIGVSRVCMFLLRKLHLGEVQASEWPNEMVEEYEKKGCIFL